jgi:hypothetical protein
MLACVQCCCRPLPVEAVGGGHINGVQAGVGHQLAVAAVGLGDATGVGVECVGVGGWGEGMTGAIGTKHTLQMRREGCRVGRYWRVRTDQGRHTHVHVTQALPLATGCCCTCCGQLTSSPMLVGILAGPGGISRCYCCHLHICQPLCWPDEGVCCHLHTVITPVRICSLQTMHAGRRTVEAPRTPTRIGLSCLGTAGYPAACRTRVSWALPSAL